MRRSLITCSAIAAMCLLLCQPLAAQDKEKDKDKAKDKNKVSENEEIIIKRKGDKDAKVTIEIKDDEITINGKPLVEFNDDNIIINRRKSLLSPLHSPFRGQSGSLSFSESEGPDNVAYLGVITEDDDKGARIEDVTDNSAAEKAGLKEGDIISKVGETKIERPDDLTKVVRKQKPGDKITITYERDGKRNQTEVALGKRKERTLNIQSPHFEAENFKLDWKDSDFGPRLSYSSGRPRLGIKAQDTEDGKGVKVLSVDDESTAEKAGIKEDDVITEFDGKKINSTDELVNAARDAKDKPIIKITFTRDGKAQTVEVKIPRKLKTANL
jgi:serine protease Do